MPKRLQLSRKKGFRLPPNAVSVARPTQWGNPYRVGDEGVPDAATAVSLYLDWLIPYRDHQTGTLDDYLMSEANLEWISALRGKDLACWCTLDQPCHADILLKYANL